MSEYKSILVEIPKETPRVLILKMDRLASRHQLKREFCKAVKDYTLRTPPDLQAIDVINIMDREGLTMSQAICRLIKKWEGPEVEKLKQKVITLQSLLKGNFDKGGQ